MFTFHIENHEPFGPLTKNCPKLDKNESIVSRYSVFVVYKSAVSTVQKLIGSELNRFRVCLFPFQYTPYTTERFGCVNVQDEKIMELT